MVVRVDHRVDQAVVDVDGFGRIGAQRAGRLLGAVGGVVVERVLESLGLPQVGLDGIGVGVDGAVEDHRPHVLRVGLGVGGADPGAVRVAEVGQLVVAQRRADGIQIPGDVDGSDIGQEVLAHLVDAAADELLGLVLDVGHARRAVVDVRLGAQPVVVGIRVAPDRRPRRPHPAGVEPDQVEPLADPLGQRLHDTQRGLDARTRRGRRG